MFFGSFFLRIQYVTVNLIFEKWFTSFADELDADALKSMDKLKIEYNKLTTEYDTKMQEKVISILFVVKFLR